MPNTPLPSPPARAKPAGIAPSSNDRERAAAFLSARFADDALTLDEFERRVAEVYRVATRAELDALSADLGAESEAVVRVAKTAVADDVPARGRRFAVMASLEHHSMTVVPRALDVSAVFGNVELDLSGATFGAGTTELRLRSVFGNIEITLPAGAQVEQHGSGILGSFEVKPSPSVAPSRFAPVVVVRGHAVFGVVEIRFADAGASGRRAPNRLDRPRRPS
jgi:hypothetical protein